MEDVLEVYHRPDDTDFPVVCMDSQPVQLVKETRIPLLMELGQPQRYDFFYERNGTASIFMFCEPKAGIRTVSVYLLYVRSFCQGERNVPEREGAKKVLKRVHDMGVMVNRLHTIWMDGGYRGEDFMRWVMDMFQWIVEIVLRPLEKKGFVLLPKRWVVERTNGIAELVSAFEQGL